MTEFVKICPKCRHSNPEYENICARCQQFIGMESAVPKPAAPIQDNKTTELPLSEAADAAPSETSAAKEKADPAQRKEVSEPVQTHPEMEKKPLALYLEIAGSQQILTINSGNIVGQAHASSLAQVQIKDNVNGVEYIHRQHCRFDLLGEKWYLYPLDQSQFQQSFTNPTQLNQHIISPEERRLITNGDELQMSGVKFIVRIL